MSETKFHSHIEPLVASVTWIQSLLNFFVLTGSQVFSSESLGAVSMNKLLHLQQHTSNGKSSVTIINWGLGTHIEREIVQDNVNQVARSSNEL
jgi:hypothetical protein